MRLDFEELTNTRDLGGMVGAGGRRIAAGRLFRSGQLYFASPADRARLDALNLGLVVDFRGADEHAEHPDPEIAGAQALYLPILRDVATGITRGREGNLRIFKYLSKDEAATPDGADAHMRAMYAGFVADSYSAGQYARFIEALLATLRSGKAALWHCTAGKDRAGFATAIVLEALGVKRADILADYLQTNDYIASEVNRLIGMFANELPTDKHREAANHFFQANATFLQAAWAAADETYGSFSAFLQQGLGLTPALQEELRALCLE